MTLDAVGSISMSNIICQKCNSHISMFGVETYERLVCRNCGAVYDANEKPEIDGISVKVSYTFVGFECLHRLYQDDCSSVCPAPYMYCKDHISEECFKRVEGNISHYNREVNRFQDQLDKMKESKKTWLIQEVSGIDEEDNPVR